MTVMVGVPVLVGLIVAVAVTVEVGEIVPVAVAVWGWQLLSQLGSLPDCKSGVLALVHSSTGMPCQ